ncbi:LEM-3-like GIY-YIG domain-containing protein [Mesorhizobium sp. ES1-4]|uniref:LEM-3-like GIY-YIG domain-containing protein n=1 Tax=Mesorhizobium sp. ES1-4 TaxID=2876627 RepID=UPI001CCC77C8|nr:hypothetical protein [Mesorhizobium sp. ES1-4]MBZ9798797.1 hypothetical protein [Mesorhizobium sp. ES1-4]
MTNLSFPPEVQDRLGFYVYRLIDPRNGETFYVGKGRGDRLFQHVKGKGVDFERHQDSVSEKIARIHDIINDGFEVSHVVQRHGLTSDEALLAEAVLIDAFPGLTNVKGGAGNAQYGVMHADAIIRLYRAETLVLKHRTIFLTIASGSIDNWYEACRGVWRIGRKRAAEAELVMPVFQGLVRDVFVPERWVDATPNNFKKLERADPSRLGFEGRRADDDVLSQYQFKRLPEDLIGNNKSMNPVRYSYGHGSPPSGWTHNSNG